MAQAEDRSYPRATKLAVVATVLLGAAFGAAGAAPAASRPAGPSAVGDDECGGLIAVTEVNGQTVCTHGPDVDAPAPGGGGATPEASPGVQCYGDGTDGKRAQLVWARGQSDPPLSPTRRAQILQAAADIDSVFNLSAARTGGARFVRWVTDGNCNLSVLDVVVSSQALSVSNPVGGYSALTQNLASEGHDRADRKYLVWVDLPATNPPPGCSGLGSFISDETGDPALNRSNREVGYTRIVETCLGVNSNRVAAHELMHTLGAVQHGAPNSSNAGHCGDEWDRMCYDDDDPDGSGPQDGPFETFISPNCPTEVPYDDRFDCNHDDYFHTAPTGTNYLVTHWNTADSGWLEPQPGPPPSPPPNDLLAQPETIAGVTGTATGTTRGATKESGEPNHAGDPGGASIWYQWTAPASGPFTFDTVGSEIDTLLAVYTQAPLTGALVAVAGNDNAPGGGTTSELELQAVSGTTYLIAIDARAGDGGATTLHWRRTDGPSVIKRVTESTVAPGETIHYGIDITNGPTPLTEVDFDDPAADSCTPAEIPDSLAPLQQVRVDCIHTATGADYSTTYANQAIVTSLETGPVASNQVQTTVAFPAHGFPDVASTRFYNEGVKFARYFGLVTGFPDGTYRPNDPVNRGQIVNMLWQLMDTPDVAPAHGFSDVPSTAFYDEALDWAKDEGLVTGFPGNLYKPKDPVNRAQLVRMLWNMVGAPSENAAHGYTDATAVWYRAALRWARANRLLDGFAAGTTFKPKQAATRGEVAYLLHRLADTPDAWSAFEPPYPTTVLF